MYRLSAANDVVYLSVEPESRAWRVGQTPVEVSRCSALGARRPRWSAWGGAPYLVDLWNNTTTRLGLYRQRGKTLQLPLHLAAKQAVVIVVDRTRKAPLHAVSTTAGHVVAVGSRLVIEADRAGTYRTTLSSEGG